MKKVKQAKKVEEANEKGDNSTAVEIETNDFHKHLDCYKVFRKARPQTVVKEEPLSVEKEPLTHLRKINSQLNTSPIMTAPSIKTEKVGDAEKSEQQLGGGVKRKRFIKTEKIDYSHEKSVKLKIPKNHSNGKFLSDRQRQIANNVQSSLASCLEITKLVVSNLPGTCTQADLLRLFGQYKSLQCNYIVDSDTSCKSLATAVLIFNDKADTAQVIKDYNGLQLDACDAVLKVELVSSMRRYEYGSPLNLIHYQVVKSPSMFRRTFNYLTIKSESVDD